MVNALKRFLQYLVVLLPEIHILRARKITIYRNFVMPVDLFQLICVYFALMHKFLALVVLFLFLVLPKLVSAAISVPVLMYHYIGENPNPADLGRNYLSVTPDKFEEQLTYLKNSAFTTISLDELYGIFNGQTQSPDNPVVLTFDDGYMDFYTTAYPILAKYNFKAVSFIPAGLVGTGYYMNWDQIKEIQKSGLVTFEGHTISHPNLTYLTPEQALYELKEGKEILQNQTGYPVNFIAYPYGASNYQIQDLAKQAGFVGGVGTWFGKSAGPGMDMPRIRITGQLTLADFAARL